MVSSIMRHKVLGAVSLLALGTTSPALAQEAPEQSTDQKADEFAGAIVVTATRRDEKLSDVPINIAAFSRDTLDALGTKSVDDLARITPNLQFSRQQFGSGNRSFISIRGIRSTVGTATTGIYIDDTPIQIRTVRSATNTNAYPQVFDLERIEVLKGPQGTLFGAGSEGGTVRFITPEPSLTETHGYGRAEVSHTEGGEMSYEAGLALSVPIAEDNFALRASGWYRRDGGYVDRVNPSTGAMIQENANRQESYAGRLAFKIRAGEDVTITPSVFHQRVSADDSGIFWQSLSDIDEGDFRAGNALASPFDDRFTLAAVKIDADLGNVALVSNSSYFTRNMASYPNYTEYVWHLLSGQSTPLDPSMTFDADYLSGQDVYTQEVRLQSTDAQARLNWTVGAYYSHATQNDFEGINGSSLVTMIPMLTGGLTIEDVFGVPLYQGYAFYDNQKSVDEQIAGFAQIDYRLMDTLKLTAGMRVSHVRFSFDSLVAGPQNGATVTTTGEQSETPVTPKIGLSWEPNDDHLFYASASKGFRPGGAQGAVGTASCGTDLADLGLDRAPTSYGSDEVWSYEVGAKNSLLGGKLSLDTSVFWIDWSRIQARVTLPSCGLGFITNVGSATSRGVDFAASLKLGGLSLNGGVGYVDATYDDTLVVGTSTIVTEGQRIARSPWSASASGQYDFPIGNVDGYARVNYQFRSAGSQTPSIVIGYDGAIPGDPATHFVGIRAGVRTSTVNLSVFVDNVFNELPNYLSRQFRSSDLFYGSTVRPRTAGITVTSNF